MTRAARGHLPISSRVARWPKGRPRPHPTRPKSCCQILRLRWLSVVRSYATLLFPGDSVAVYAHITRCCAGDSALGNYSIEPLAGSLARFVAAASRDPASRQPGADNFVSLVVWIAEKIQLQASLRRNIRSAIVVRHAEQPTECRSFVYTILILSHLNRLPSVVVRAVRKELDPTISHKAVAHGRWSPILARIRAGVLHQHRR